jgi:alkylmercury lyase
VTDTSTLIDRLSQALADGMLELNPDEARIVLATYRLLSLGDPVQPSQIAEQTGIDFSVVEERLGSWPGVFKQDGAVVSFWGLALPKMTHRFEMDGKALYTWCAYDALFLPELIGKTARVTSRERSLMNL